MKELIESSTNVSFQQGDILISVKGECYFDDWGKAVRSLVLQATPFDGTTGETKNFPLIPLISAEEYGPETNLNSLKAFTPEELIESAERFIEKMKLLNKPIL